MSAIRLAVAGLAVLLLLAGCTSASKVEGSTSLYEERVLLNDGRYVLCVIYSGYQAGGLSCDWDRAR